MKKKLLTFVITIIVMCHVSLFSAPIESFNYDGVKLNDSRLKTQTNLIKAEYLSIPNNDLLKGFRIRAGLPAPGYELDGWYTRDFFHVFGQMISGLSRMYAATGDTNCRDKVNYLIAEWEKTIEPNGFFYYTRKPNAPHYTYDKMVCGLVDAKLYCNNAQALDCLSRITDWAIANLDQTRIYAFNAASGNTEWYTLTENLYRAYLLTGDQKYKNFGDVWAYTEFWDIFASNGNVFDRWNAYHAYSHLNSVNGAGPEYIVTGHSHYLDTLKNAHDYWLSHQTYATGGYGPHEYLQGDFDHLIGQLLGDSHFETQCGSWAVFKLCKYLITSTGDARYGDWVEAMTYNGIGASIPLNNGLVHYFSSYSIYGSTKQTINKWSCCTGTRSQAAADYTDLVWFKDASNLYVNLYTPSNVSCTYNGVSVIVAQHGMLEVGEDIEFTVTCPMAVSFGMKFRVPSWISGTPIIKVNGTLLNATITNEHWLEVNRIWQNGDKITIKLPMNLWVKRVDPAKAYPCAIMYGPITLAAEPAGLNKLPALDLTRLNHDFALVSGKVATFAKKNDPEVILKPYYSYLAGERYFMYIDPKMDDFAAFTFGGTWNGNETIRYTNATGADITGTFYGNYIKVEWLKYNDAGNAEIKIDGEVAAVIDQYAPCRGCENGVWSTCLGNNGEHSFNLRVLGTKNTASSGTYINVSTITYKNTQADLNCDGKVDLLDLADFSEEWLADNTATPEHVTIGTPVFMGSWADGNFFGWSLKRTAEDGATVGCSFRGSGIRLCGGGYRDGGIAEVIIDGVAVNTQDFYTSTDNRPLNFDYTALSESEHYITVRATNLRNPASTGQSISFLRFESIDPGPFVFSGTWNGSTSPVTDQPFWWSAVANASISRTFTGTGIKLISTSWDDSGIAQIQVDGIDRGNVDLYQANVPDGTPFQWQFNGLENGPHTVTIKVTGTKNPSSTGYAINVVDLIPS